MSKIDNTSILDLLEQIERLIAECKATQADLRKKGIIK